MFWNFFDLFLYSYVFLYILPQIDRAVLKFMTFLLYMNLIWTANLRICVLNKYRPIQLCLKFMLYVVSFVFFIVLFFVMFKHRFFIYRYGFSCMNFINMFVFFCCIWILDFFLFVCYLWCHDIKRETTHIFI